MNSIEKQLSRIKPLAKKHKHRIHLYGLFLLFLLVFLTIYYVSSPTSILNFVAITRAPLSTAQYQNGLNIVTGIGAVIIALFVFIAESYRESKLRGQALLKITRVSFLSGFYLLSLLVYINTTANYILIWLLISLVLFTLFSLTQLIHSLSKTERLNALQTEFLYKKATALMRDEIQTRIKTNQFLDELKKHKFIKYTPIHTADEKYTIRSQTKATISFIEVSRLVRLLNNAIEKSTVPALIESDHENITAPTDTEKNPITVYIHRIPNETIGERTPLLSISYSSGYQNEAEFLYNQLKKQYKKICTLQHHESSIGDKIQTDLQDLTSQFIEGIQGDKRTTIEDSRLILKGFLDKFIVDFNKTLQYNSNSALRERHSIGGQWTPVGEIISDLRSIVKAAIDAGSKDNITDIIYLPTHFANLGIKLNNHYVFQEFISINRTLFDQAYKLAPENPVRDLLIDRSWRYITKTVNYNIESRLEEAYSSEEDASLIEFAQFALTIYQHYFYAAWKYGDYPLFEKLNKHLWRLLDGYNPSHIMENAEELKFELDSVDSADVLAKSEIRDRLDKQKKREQNKKIFHDYRRSMFYGLMAWATSQPLEDQNNEILKFGFERLPNKLDDLKEILYCSLDDTLQHFFSWSSWELEGTEGEVITIQTNDNLCRLYAWKALEIIHKNPQVKLTFDNKSVFRFKEDQIIQQTIQKIAANVDELKWLIPDLTTEDCQLLLKTIREAVGLYDAVKLIVKRTQPLEVEKVAEFKAKLLEHYNSEPSLKNMLKHYNLLHKQAISELANPICLKGHMDKEGFIDSEITVVGAPGIFSRDLVRIEDAHILKHLLTAAKIVSLGQLNQLVQAIQQPALLVSGNIEIRLLESNSNYIPRWRVDTSEYDSKDLPLAGFYKTGEKTIPVFLHAHKAIDNERTFLIVDTEKIGLMSTGMNAEGNNIDIDIQNFSSDPALLKKYVDKGNNEDFLKENVLIEIIDYLDVTFNIPENSIFSIKLNTKKDENFKTAN